MLWHGRAREDAMNRFHDISQKFPAEAAAPGRLLAGYADLEISLMNCVQIARGGDLDTVRRPRMKSRRLVNIQIVVALND